MRVIDNGHKYELLTLDGRDKQVLTFVKRMGKNYPANYNAHSGTTLQSVLRACIHRVAYLDWQKEAPENKLISWFLKASVWLLERRAARLHGLSYWKGLKYAVSKEMCTVCGHTFCKHDFPLFK